MSVPAQRSTRAPLARVAAAHAIGVPLALLIAPAGLPWEPLAAALAVALGCVFGLAV